MSARPTRRISLPDGLEALASELELREIMRLIERTARWVAPETFRLLPVWFPEYARRSLFYKADWSEPQLNRNRETGVAEHKREGDRYAAIALAEALGLKSRDRPNWSCCHIWGVDDPTFQKSNAIVQDHRFFSCVGNMVLLPTPLKAFTDALPAVKAMLRHCATNLYGWSCDPHDRSRTTSERSDDVEWNAYPERWPTSDVERRPPGTLDLTPAIEAAVRRRKAAIGRDLGQAGPHYPREAVLQALAYWRVAL